MGFFNNIKRAFGFSPSGDDEEYDYLDMTSRRAIINPYSRDVEQSAAEKDDLVGSAPIAPEDDDKLKKTLAEFLENHQQSLMTLIQQHYADLEAQRKLNADQLKTEAEERIDQLRERLNTSEAQRRQAQARANDLVARVAQLESDVEQLDLEKKSLMNKMKIQQLQGGSYDDQATPPAVDNEELENLRHQLEELHARKTALEERLTEVEAENEQYEQVKQQIEAMMERDRQRKQSMTELKSRCQLLEQQIQQAEAERQQADIDCQQAKDLAQDSQQQLLKLQQEYDRQQRTMRETVQRHTRRDIEMANQVNDLKSQLLAAGRLADDFRDQLADEQRRSATFEQDCRHAQQEIDRLKTELDKAQHSRPEPATAPEVEVRKDVDALPAQKERRHRKPKNNPEDNVPIELSHMPDKAVEGVGISAVAEEPNVVGPSVDDIDDIDWLLPAQPDPLRAPEPEPDPEPVLPQRPDPRQLSLF